MAWIDRIALNVADLDRAIQFYRGLGFVPGDAGRHHGGRYAMLKGEGAGLELVEADTPGAPYATRCGANDAGFQHFAIAVSDMPAAYVQLRTLPFAPISRDGPQLLPPSTGSVTAFKFRDPDGHPLELSYNPARAREPGAPLFLGIDHTALAVSDIDASVAWYRATLGAKPTMRLLNEGPEQDRLDALDDVRLDILVLELDTGPHIELLHYAQPKAAAGVLARGAFDIAATQTIVHGRAHIDDLTDPDGHRFILRPGR